MVPFSYRQTVRFPDVDHAGIVFFGTLITYCHHAHEEWLAMLGHPLHTLVEAGWGFPIVSTSSSFYSPAHHGDVLRIDVLLNRLGNSSLALDYEIHNETKDWPVGKLSTTQVCTDIVAMRSMHVPGAFRQAVARWQSANAS